VNRLTPRSKGRILWLLKQTSRVALWTSRQAQHLTGMDNDLLRDTILLARKYKLIDRDPGRWEWRATAKGRRYLEVNKDWRLPAGSASLPFASMPLKDDEPTLRDYFANQALGWITATYNTYSPDEYAEKAYVIADAMLKARKREETQ
jgi:hypothetical protein